LLAVTIDRCTEVESSFLSYPRGDQQIKPG
jgi:hypothetical protein